MDCKELIESGDKLREQQIRINATLKHEHDKLAQNAKLQDRHQELLRQLKEHGLAVRRSVELQDEADAALKRGDAKEAERLMQEAASVLPEYSEQPEPQPAPERVEPVPVKDEPAPASPPAEPVAEMPETPASPPTPPASPTAPPVTDTSDMEERIKAHFDNGLGAIRDQVAGVALPDGYREVLDRYSPEDLEMALKAGRWINDKRWNRKDKSAPSHNHGVAEDGNPHH